jgi:hypothetical protein
MRPPASLNRREIELLLDVIRDLARDDRATRENLVLMLTGHPGSHVDNGDSGPPHPDPVGEAAIAGDRAYRDGRNYERHIRRAAEELLAADRIRATYTARANVEPPDPTEWCSTCLAAGVCSPRTANGGKTCSWCRSIRQAWGFDPTPEIIRLHREGRRVDKQLAALKASLKRRGRRRPRAA